MDVANEISVQTLSGVVPAPVDGDVTAGIAEAAGGLAPAAGT